jgi:ankyrin repeat protein
VPDPLIEALRRGKVASVRAALRADPDAARRPRPAVEAGRLAFQKALELLHRNGADLNASWRGYRPLHALLQEDPHAAGGKPSAERLACLDWLLEHGADPEQLGGWPLARAIITAAFVGEREYVKRLRKAGARIDGFAGAALGARKLVEKTLRTRPGFARERDCGGLTALQCAAGSRAGAVQSLEIARLLLDAGAEAEAATESWGHSVDAVYFAASAKNKAVFALLLERGADATQALVPALWNGTLDFAELAVSHGAEVDRAVTEGKPLLNHLICWGQIPQTFWLLSHGASPNIADGRGWTAVHQAVSRGNLRILRAVLEAGGDCSRRDREGATPLDIARALGRDKLAALLR